MKVTVVIPTTVDRHEFNSRICSIYDSQDYPEKQLLLLSGSTTIGAKLNEMCTDATGEIILRMDSDDQYAPDWISKSVIALITSGADCVGLSSAYFHRTKDNQIFHFSNKPNTQLFLCGATLCFWRKAWEKVKFPDSSAGEDRDWQTNIKRAGHNYTDGFLATIHGANTCSHTAIPLMKKVPLDAALSILNRFY